MNFGDNGPLPLDHIIHCPVESIIVVGMFVNIIIALLVAQVACSEDTANLRGHSKEKEKKALFNSATPYPIESRPKSNEAFVSKLFADMRENLEKEKAKAAAPKSELDYYQGGQGPQLSYGGYFVSRQRKLGNNWNECVGPVETLVARSMECQRTGESSSTIGICQQYSDGSVYLAQLEYTGSTDCTGSYYYSTNMGLNGCSYGYSVQCVPHNNVPAFVEKEGLTTYKFRYPYDCFNFASNYLNYYPYGTDDHPDIDDYAPSGLPSDYYDKCCSQYSIDEGCPFPLCTEGQMGPPGGEGRRLGADAALASTAKWWETQEFKDKLAAPKVHEAAAAPAVATHKASTQKSSPADAVVASTSEKAAQSDKQAQAWPYREYSLVQHRNGACTYEEKYDLWVKTTCHGARNQISYTIFADEECTRAIKKADHHIFNAVPHYGECVVAENGNGRTSLTVCHNDGVPSFPQRA